SDNTIRLWKIDKGISTKTFEGHKRLYLYFFVVSEQRSTLSPLIINRTLKIQGILRFNLIKLIKFYTRIIQFK
ncbi:hypothetical protein BpHYR1_048269, partial [Brachionus plicatilis]